MGEEPNLTGLVAKSSSAHNYNYASLSDIVIQGYKIPKMRVARIEDDEYIQYKDDDGEWQLGARIIIPDLRNSNDSQKYGAGLTYARRYTAELALALACDEDKKIEESKPFDLNATLKAIQTANVVEELNNIYSQTPAKHQASILQACMQRKKELVGGQNDKH